MHNFGGSREDTLFVNCHETTVRDLDSDVPIALVNQPEILHRWRQPVVVPTIVALALARPIPELAVTYGFCGVAAVLEVSEARAPMCSITFGLALVDVGGPVTLHADLAPIGTPNVRLLYQLPRHCAIGHEHERARGGVESPLMSMSMSMSMSGSRRAGHEHERVPLGILRSPTSTLQQKQHGNYR